MVTLGIVGGLGTETSCSFCLNVNHDIKRRHEVQPHILMDNVPISKIAESHIARGEESAEVNRLLTESVQRLNSSKADLLVVPCNTVHTFIDQMRLISKVPVMSIIEETVRECQRLSIHNVGVLGSTTTIKKKLYANELQKHRIKAIVPDVEDQHFVTECILRIINLGLLSDDKQRMIEVIGRLKNRGAEAVILGCTDLFLIVSSNEVSIPLINSTEVLEKAAIEWLSSQLIK